ncbi:PREDICTED: uncharacterized protein LOC109333611 isoform X3 [Lupinus angustifolius]|uniref:uncharacterized protein LOC109333611 isoform X3 n=2 Tax=Lupinus angustifolius TaxID=3871 RepID=UPI00092E299A|nr:PREDICTED: uncharacterized protein LOC109333611 isoform X3 [Lupinus angustifolius]
MAANSKRRHVSTRLSFNWKLLILFFSVSLSCVVVLASLFRLHYSNNNYSNNSSRLTRSSISRVFNGPPKIAFLFLVRRNIPLDFLWGTFFQNGVVSKFSIYVHSTPGFVLDDSTTRSRFFKARQINNSIQVSWGESSMIQAEKLLLEAALEDPANQRFVLLSDSCVPLYNFSYVYDYVMASPRSFVDSFLDVKEGRYNPKMSPKIPREKWRKGSQWITLIRSHAEVIVDDDIIFSVFKKYCKRRPPIDSRKGKLNLKLQKQHNCIPDEHYVQTLLAMHDLEGELERRTLTYTLWNQSAAKKENQWHPMTFSYANANPQRIKDMKVIFWCLILDLNIDLDI